MYLLVPLAKIPFFSYKYFGLTTKLAEMLENSVGLKEFRIRVKKFEVFFEIWFYSANDGNDGSFLKLEPN